MTTREISAGNIRIGNRNPLAFIAGPCVIESEESTLKAAHQIKSVADRLNIPVIFKSSYDKANRTSLTSFRGPGIDKGLAILDTVKKETGLAVLSDIHSIQEIGRAAEVLDIIQIPAFLCRQTEIVLEAARTGRTVNVKKGQFLAPRDVKNIIEKIISENNHNIIITERGTSFGYNNLVVDMRGIPIMQGFGFPVVFDSTHSVQLPGGQGSSSGGEREFIETLARSAVAAGCDAVFMEVHEDPDKAPCDGSTMLPIERFSHIAGRLMELHKMVKGWENN
ncbi:MAG: 3-deoxy-8-phosphooctulonate synthase [Nitrospiraceae bacterium]|nr:MAG: 3-deoxy-8-phosphooctulonate synthase [Nitrospiraceae bacterium]